jgi:hypothetical protein
MMGCASVSFSRVVVVIEPGTQNEYRAFFIFEKGAFAEAVT